MKIQLLHTEGCTPGSSEAAGQALQEALAQLGLEAEVEDVLITTPEESSRHGMVGGPAILINGVDVDPGVRDMKAGGLGCRAYFSPQGITNYPPVSMIVAALQEALAEDPAGLLPAEVPAQD